MRSKHSDAGNEALEPQSLSFRKAPAWHQELNLPGLSNELETKIQEWPGFIPALQNEKYISEFKVNAHIVPVDISMFISILFMAGRTDLVRLTTILGERCISIHSLEVSPPQFNPKSDLLLLLVGEE